MHRFCAGARQLLKRNNDVMRKRVVTDSLPNTKRLGGKWLDVQDLAQVEVTSEADGYPIESAFGFEAGPGWRAAFPGRQTIRLVFDSPQSIHRLFLQFNDAQCARTQEFTV